MAIVNSTPLRALKIIQGSKTRKIRQNRRKRKKEAIQNIPMIDTENNLSNFKPSKIHGISHALDTAIQLTPSGETLFVIPTYTGLLEIHHELERRGLTPRYWEESGP
jgi:hypothetical protein